jgi:hypothetical protein
MIWQDKAFLAFYFLVIIIVQCFWQKALFKRNMPISHFWHGVYYCLTILPMMYFFLPVWWAVALIAVAERLALFDFLLNKIRGKPLWYNELSALWVKVLKVLYVLIFVTVLIII